MKLTIVGAGQVGSQATMFCAQQGINEIVLLDNDPDRAKGKALDISQASAMAGHSCRVTGTDDYALTQKSDIAVITAGLARRPGMSRSDLLKVNAKIIAETSRQIVAHSPETLLVIVTNPVNITVQLAQYYSELPYQRVIGMSGVLDSARFRALLAEQCNMPAAHIEAMVIGDHGDYMVPLISHAKIGDQPLSKVLADDELNAIVARVQQGGTEIVNLLKSGSAFFAPGLAVAHMVKALQAAEPTLMPCAAYLRGEYGEEGIYMGAPTWLSNSGMTGVEVLPLSGNERRLFEKSAIHIRSQLKDIAQELGISFG